MKKFILPVIMVFLFLGCKKENLPEEIVLINKIYYSGGDIRCGVSYNNVRCPENPEFGIVWSLSTSPTIEVSNKNVISSQCMTTVGSESIIDNAPADKKLYFRAYAKTKTSPGVIYSEEVSFER